MHFANQSILVWLRHIGRYVSLNKIDKLRYYFKRNQILFMDDVLGPVYVISKKFSPSHLPALFESSQKPIKVCSKIVCFTLRYRDLPIEDCFGQFQRHWLRPFTLKSLIEEHARLDFSDFLSTLFAIFHVINEKFNPARLLIYLVNKQAG